MIKAIALLRRKPGLSTEQFRKHYEEVHAPLAKRTFSFIFPNPTRLAACCQTRALSQSDRPQAGRRVLTSSAAE